MEDFGDVTLAYTDDSIDVTLAQTLHKMEDFSDVTLAQTITLHGRFQ